MEDRKKEGRYKRIYKQLEELTTRSSDPLAHMATICAVLHHKMDDYFWTGFYLLKEVENKEILVVGPYQGPVACQELPGPDGVCWAAVKTVKTVVVEDVQSFPGHVACDSRTASEITLPVYDLHGKVSAVFDVDSDKTAAFNQLDAKHLEEIMKLVFR